MIHCIFEHVGQQGIRFYVSLVHISPLKNRNLTQVTSRFMVGFFFQHSERKCIIMFKSFEATQNH